MVDSESLLNVANKFRESHPELIPQETTPAVTGIASPTNSSVTTELKPLSQMSFDEKKALMNNPSLMEEYKSKGLL